MPCTYVHACMYVLTHECTYTLTQACTYVLTHACTYVPTHACTYVLTHACTYLQIRYSENAPAGTNAVFEWRLQAERESAQGLSDEQVQSVTLSCSQTAVCLCLTFSLINFNSQSDIHTHTHTHTHMYIHTYSCALECIMYFSFLGKGLCRPIHASVRRVRSSTVQCRAPKKRICTRFENYCRH